jgi:hypothetical protein
VDRGRSRRLFYSLLLRTFRWYLSAADEESLDHSNGILSIVLFGAVDKDAGE